MTNGNICCLNKSYIGNMLLIDSEERKYGNLCESCIRNEAQRYLVVYAPWDAVALG